MTKEVWGQARKRPIEVMFREPVSDREPITTHAGEVFAVKGIHYVIEDVEGLLYPITKEIFYKTYDVIKPPKERMELSLWKRLVLLVNGNVFLRYEKREGWSKHLAIFLVKCNKHGFFEDWKHGRGNFQCPTCLEEKKTRRLKGLTL